MKHILTIIGARPQIIKASAISRCIARSFSNQIKESVLHTGQHYDHNMSGVLMEEMELKTPDIQLNIGSGSHGEQTAQMIIEIERAINSIRPDAVLVYGDTNSTLAGALAAVKLHIPVIHIEAGMRSFNKSMPEEVNRIACDHMSTFLFSPTTTGVLNLQNEGISNHEEGIDVNHPMVKHCGDVMFDNALFFAKRGRAAFEAKWDGNSFYLLTLHRPYNVDDADQLNGLLHAINDAMDALDKPCLFPVHPRTKQKIKEGKEYSNISFIDPLTYLEMLGAEQCCDGVLTDSGGVQKEAYFFEKQCAVIRTETEWVELLDNKSTQLFPSPIQDIQGLINHFMQKSEKTASIFGDGNASDYICKMILKHL